MKYDVILYEARNGMGRITINRPDKYNAFRGHTCDQLILAVNEMRKSDFRRYQR